MQCILYKIYFWKVFIYTIIWYAFLYALLFAQNFILVKSGCYIWILSHNHYLFELLTWSYSDSNSTWSPPQLNFQLNRIPHPWTLLGSVMAHLGLGSTLLELKVLIQLWTQTPSQFELVSSIFFLNSFGQLTRVTFTLSAYPISPNRLTRILPE
jgi:hypothetical protein